MVKPQSTLKAKLHKSTNYIIYFHRRADDNQLFYVGVGKNEFRSRDFPKRGVHWNNIVAKHGVVVEIVNSFLTREKAIELEVFYIKKYGRIGYEDRAILCNKTLGGEGSCGRIPWNFGLKNHLPEETIQKMRNQKLGRPLSPEHKRKLSIRGASRIIAETTRQKLSSSKKGNNNHMSRSVINVDSGVIYETCRAAANELGYNYAHLGCMLNDKLPNYSQCLYSDVYELRYSGASFKYNENHFLFKEKKTKQVPLRGIIYAA